MVAHFDYFYNVGPGLPTEDHPEYMVGTRGVVLIPKSYISNNIQMNTTNTTEGGYAASLPNTTHCPAIAATMQTVFGSYLLSFPAIISSSINANTASGAISSWMGAANGWTWTKQMCILPNEIQIYGASIASSSFYDYGEACEKLAVFNFIKHNEFGRVDTWLRSVASHGDFAVNGGNGNATKMGASNLWSIRPLIYIG